MSEEIRSKNPRIFKGNQIRCALFPLGGIGTGTICLAGDGSLRQFQIMNEVFHNAEVPGAFFAISTKPQDSGLRITKILQSSPSKDENFKPAPSVSDYIEPEHFKFYEDLPHVERTELIGTYPIAEIDYFDKDIPIDIKLQAFSPFIPNNSESSSVPGIYFDFILNNPTKQIQEVSLIFSMQNIIGWSGLKNYAKFGNATDFFGRNINKRIEDQDKISIDMSSDKFLRSDPEYGTISIGSWGSGMKNICKLSYEQIIEFFKEFSFYGDFNVNKEKEERGTAVKNSASRSNSISSEIGKTFYGAVGKKVDLLPGIRRKVQFILTWNFPNRFYKNTLPPSDGFDDKNSLFWLGNNYSKNFKNSQKTAIKLIENYNLFREYANKFAEIMQEAEKYINPDLIFSAECNIAVLRSPTMFWPMDGNFYGYEGCSGASNKADFRKIEKLPVGGCCPLNCTHVYNYEMTIAHLFPELERTMRMTDLSILTEDGILPHRVRVPLYLPQLGSGRIGGPPFPALDGNLGEVLKIFREYQFSGDIEWLKGVFKHVKTIIKGMIENFDENEEGVIRGVQNNTYDIAISGVNTFIGTLYLAALRTGEEIAKIIGDNEFEEKCRGLFEKGSGTLDRECWNGQYYIHKHTESEDVWSIGNGCFTDQLLGQWWAYILGLGNLLPPEHIKTALQSIVKNNFRENFKEHLQSPREYLREDESGLLNCSWTEKTRPKKPILYGDEVWPGLEYTIIGMCIANGLFDEADTLISALRKRQNGEYRSPWNEVECGDYYVRSMASWGLILISSGIRYIPQNKMLFIDPKTPIGNYDGIYSISNSWGELNFQREKTDEFKIRIVIEPSYGKFELKGFIIPSCAKSKMDNLKAFATKNNKTINGTLNCKENILNFESLVEIKKGDTLIIIIE